MNPDGPVLDDCILFYGDLVVDSVSFLTIPWFSLVVGHTAMILGRKNIEVAKPIKNHLGLNPHLSSSHVSGHLQP